jgi:hypothetical protein
MGYMVFGKDITASITASATLCPLSLRIPVIPATQSFMQARPAPPPMK